jgi:preprotein translocase subunit SecF
VGIGVGTYSSIFIATPVVAQLKERDPAMQALAKRVAARRAGARPTTARGEPVAAVAGDPQATDGTAASSDGAAAPAATKTANQPASRGPRNQPKRKPKRKR